MATLGGYPAVTVKSVIVDEGSFQLLVCEKTKVTPNATYSWGVTSSTTDPSVVPVALSERISMDADGVYSSCLVSLNPFSIYGH